MASCAASLRLIWGQGKDRILGLIHIRLREDSKVILKSRGGSRYGPWEHGLKKRDEPGEKL